MDRDQSRSHMSGLRFRAVWGTARLHNHSSKINEYRYAFSYQRIYP